MAWSENQSCGGWWEREGEWSGNGSEGQGDSGPTSRPGDCGQVEEKQPQPAKAAEEACPGTGRSEGWLGGGEEPSGVTQGPGLPLVGDTSVGKGVRGGGSGQNTQSSWVPTWLLPVRNVL